MSRCVHGEADPPGSDPGEAPPVTLLLVGSSSTVVGVAIAAGIGAVAPTTPRALCGPSSQLKRSVLSRMKWISSASANRNVNKATSARRGSNSNQILHMDQIS